MNFLINTSNIQVGGGTQVSLSFIHHLKKYTQHEFHVFASDKVYAQINFEVLGENVKVTKVNFGLKQVLLGKTSDIQKLAEQINPDAVFTIFGPSYWSPNAPHLMGFALPWLINPESKAFAELSLKMWLKKKTQNLIKGYFTKRNAKYFVVETLDVKQRLKTYFDIPLDNTWVVDNTYNQFFSNVDILPTKKNEVFELITITANYPHKNLKVIKKVIPILRKRGIKARFTLTISDKEFENMFGVENDYVRNIGPLNWNDCPKHYNQSDALFLPTLLECFTASYPEAMIMERPILTSNLSFAQKICGDENALFFDPLDAADIADKIEELINDSVLYTKLVEGGKKRVKEFLTYEQRAEKYINILEQIV